MSYLTKSNQYQCYFCTDIYVRRDSLYIHIYNNHHTTIQIPYELFRIFGSSYPFDDNRSIWSKAFAEDVKENNKNAWNLSPEHPKHPNLKIHEGIFEKYFDICDLVDGQMVRVWKLFCLEEHILRGFALAAHFLEITELTNVALKCLAFLMISRMSDKDIKETFDIFMLTCDECSSGFETLELFKEHYTLFHCKLECKQDCQNLPASDKSYMVVNLGNGKYFCICGKSYLTWENLRLHYFYDKEKPKHHWFPGRDHSTIQRIADQVEINEAVTEKILTPDIPEDAEDFILCTGMDEKIKEIKKETDDWKDQKYDHPRKMLEGLTECCQVLKLSLYGDVKKRQGKKSGKYTLASKPLYGNKYWIQNVGGDNVIWVYKDYLYIGPEKRHGSSIASIVATVPEECPYNGGNNWEYATKESGFVSVGEGNVKIECITCKGVKSCCQKIKLVFNEDLSKYVENYAGIYNLSPTLLNGTNYWVQEERDCFMIWVKKDHEFDILVIGLKQPFGQEIKFCTNYDEATCPHKVNDEWSYYNTSKVIGKGQIKIECVHGELE